MIDMYDKMSNTVSRLGYILVVIEVSFFFLERAYESFSISVIPSTRRATEISTPCRVSVER